MRVRRLSSGTALAVLGLLVLAGSASACSCSSLLPAEYLRESDAAIVGRLVAVVPAGQLRADYRYQVERVYRGGDSIEPGQMLSVRSARRGAGCALPRRLDDRYGLFLTRAGGRWISGMCGVIAPHRLRSVAQNRSHVDRRSSGGDLSCA